MSTSHVSEITCNYWNKSPSLQLESFLSSAHTHTHSHIQPVTWHPVSFGVGTQRQHVCSVDVPDENKGEPYLDSPADPLEAGVNISQSEDAAASAVSQQETGGQGVCVCVEETTGERMRTGKERRAMRRRRERH